LTNESENIVVIVNNNEIVRFNVEPKCWSIRPLGFFDEINYVRIDNTKNTLFEKYFDDEFREIFKGKSYITFS
jgi:hypothetical protein